MLNKFIERLKIEASFFSNKKSHQFSIDPTLRNLSKKYEDIDAYLDFHISSRKKLSLDTNTQLIFPGKIKTGSSYKSIKRRLLNPLAEYSTNGLFNTDILFYNLKYQGFKAKIEFHFYEKKLFYIDCNLGEISFDDRKEILDELIIHYSIHGIEPANHKITDHKGQTLCIESVDSFRIIMADSGNSFFTELSKIEIFYNRKQSSNIREKAVFTAIEPKTAFTAVKSTG